jgi:hypothetical protein
MLHQGTCLVCAPQQRDLCLCVRVRSRECRQRQGINWPLPQRLGCTNQLRPWATRSPLVLIANRLLQCRQRSRSSHSRSSKILAAQSWPQLQGSRRPLAAPS